MQLKDDLVFVVQAYRWAELENHNYIVGAFSTKSKAVKAAEAEEEYRGGKYCCTIYELKVNSTTHINCVKHLTEEK